MIQYGIIKAGDFSHFSQSSQDNFDATGLVLISGKATGDAHIFTKIHQIPINKSNKKHAKIPHKRFLREIEWMERLYITKISVQ